MPTLQEKLHLLPDSPGVYLMKDAGEVIYIGKAVSLKNRVRQYFQATRGHGPKVRAMVEKIDDFDIILCDSELEALMLECNLIKKNRPWYNILLKDDKHYPYIRVGVGEAFPTATMVRKAEQDGARYFGPYQGTTLIRDVLDVVRAVFPLRTCTRDMAKRAARPCLQHELGRCLAPCVGRVGQEEYAAVAAQVVRFLSGKQGDVVRDLQAQMVQAVADLQFERAAVLRDRIAAIEGLEQKQKVLTTGGDDMDVLALSRIGEDAVINALFLRDGKLIGAENFPLERLGEESEAELLQEFMLQFYDDAPFVPPRVLLPAPLPDASVMEELLGQKKGAKVALLVPQRGDKKKLVDMAGRNAKDALAKHLSEQERKSRRSQGAMAELQAALGLPVLPRRIEAYDISNTQGAQSVASMVVFQDGDALRSGYRQFKIRTVVGADDFASMQEALTRRFRHAAEGDERFGALPDAVLIDGGPEQLKRALEGMRSQGFSVPMFSLAKQLEEVYLEGRDDTILLPRHGEALHLIQRIRDEAHRFAITSHRALRGKASVRSALDDIAGVGPTRKRALLQHFGSISKIAAATREELRAVKGVDSRSAEAVYGHFHPPGPADA